MLSIILNILSVLAVLGVLFVLAVVFYKPATPPKEKDDPSTATSESTPSENSVRGTRRRVSTAQGLVPTGTDASSLEHHSHEMKTNERRPSFRTNSPPLPNETQSNSGSLPPLTINVSSLEPRASALASAASPILEARRSSLLASPGRTVSPSSDATSPSSPKLGQMKKQTSGRGVTFSTESNSPRLSKGSVTTSLGLPGVFPFEEVSSRMDVVESASFSEDGLLAIGGGPEDVTVRIFNKGTGTIGSLRHTIDIQHDCKKHDSPSVLNFAHDEGKKSSLLLVGTRSERFLLAYKISKSVQTPPLFVFCIETKHGSPLAGALGYIPKEATSFFDPGVFYATCARGTREVKLWSGKGAALAVIDCECWTMGLRLSPNGKNLAVLSSGGGPGVLVDIKRDKHMHLKFTKAKLALPIDSSTAPLSPQLANRRSVVGDLAFQASQDFVFYADGTASLACCRADVAISIAHVSSLESASATAAWELETLLKPDCLQLSSPTRITVLIPKAEGRQMRVLVSRGKHLFFFDTNLSLIGVLEGRREDGDVLGVALSPKADFIVVVAFGASVARLVAIT